MLRRPTVVTVAIALVVTLTACTESARIPDADPSSEVAPLFASDDEALAAALDAYQSYIVVTNAVSASQDADTSLLSEVAVPSHVDTLSESIESLRAAGLRTEGQAVLEAISLQQTFEEANGDVTVVIYACLDLTNLRVVDAQGIDQTPPDREDLVGLEVELWAINDLAPYLKVAASEAWTDGDLCGA
jgi:hypothetical protein